MSLQESCWYFLTYDGQTYAGGGEQSLNWKTAKQIQIHLVEDGGAGCAIDVVLVNGSFFQPVQKI